MGRKLIATAAESSASGARFWSLLRDLPAWPVLLPTFDSVIRVGGDGPIGVGSQFTVRQPGLPPATYTVTDWTAGRSFTWVARSPGIQTTASHTIDTFDNGSRLQLTIEWAGPLATLVHRLLGSRTRAMIESEADTFVHLAEQA